MQKPAPNELEYLPGLQMAGVLSLVPSFSVTRRAARPLGPELGTEPWAACPALPAAPGCVHHLQPQAPPAAPAGRRAFPAQTAFIYIVHLPSEVANTARKFPSRFLAVVSANREKVGGSQPCTVHTARILILRQLQTLAVYVKLQSQHEKI